MSRFSTIHAAAIQMVSTPVVAENLAAAEDLIARAADAGATLVVLPEYFAIMGGRDTDKLVVAETLGHGVIQDAMAHIAMKHQISLAAGTIPLRCGDPEKVRNSLLFFGPDGKNLARYDKMHLFGFDNGTERYREADTIEPGDGPVAFDTPLGRVGLAVCYDLRFPEYFRALGRVDVLLVPAAFTATTGRAHWDTLIRARAIENQCFVVASGQGGIHVNGRETWGHSMLVDPWGQVLDCLPQGEGLVTAELKASQLDRVRKVLPVLDHRVM